MFSMYIHCNDYVFSNEGLWLFKECFFVCTHTFFCQSKHANYAGIFTGNIREMFRRFVRGIPIDTGTVRSVPNGFVEHTAIYKETYTFFFLSPQFSVAFCLLFWLFKMYITKCVILYVTQYYFM